MKNLTFYRTEPIRGEFENGTSSVATVQSVIAPILLFVGITGNSLSFAMMQRRNLRRLTTCFYLSCLSIADLFCVCFGLFPVVLFAITSGRINARSWLDCRFVDFFSYFSTDVSVWIVVVMTVDRYVATCRPVLALKFCKKKVAKRILVAVIFFLFSLNFHLVIFYTFGVEESENAALPDCIPTSVSSHFFHTTWPWIDFTVYSFLPDVIIFTFNIIIIRSITRKKKITHGDSNTQFRRQTFKMTRILLVVSTITLICISPITIIQIAEEYDTYKVDDVISWELAFAIGNLLMYANHSINFVLFCLTGSRFRRELLLMFGIRSNTVQIHTVSSRNLPNEETVQ